VNPEDNVPQDAEQRAAQAKAKVVPHPSALREARQYLNWGVLEQRGQPPRRDWIADGWLGSGHVTLLSGAGGMGKSILAQQWGSHIALGSKFIAEVERPRVVLYWAAEDSHNELWRRQYAIGRSMNRDLSAFVDRLHIVPLDDADCTLCDQTEFSRSIVRTSVLEELRQQIGDLKAEVVILDNIARLFGGNENDRHQVTQFMAALNYAAAPTSAGILLLGHIARSIGSEFSGSAAWENAARSRLWLTKKLPDQESAESDEDGERSDYRYLAKRKTNYAAPDICTLQYQPDGESGAYKTVLAPGGSIGRSFGIVASIDNERARKTVLAGLQKLTLMGLVPSDAKTSGSYLPRLLIEHTLAAGFQRVDLARAMRALMTDGKLRREIVGKASNRSSDRYGLVEVEAALAI
jgi:hypothetical protein